MACVGLREILKPVRLQRFDIYVITRTPLSYCRHSLSYMTWALVATKRDSCAYENDNKHEQADTTVIET